MFSPLSCKIKRPTNSRQTKNGLRVFKKRVKTKKYSEVAVHVNIEKLKHSIHWKRELKTAMIVVLCKIRIEFSSYRSFTFGHILLFLF